MEDKHPYALGYKRKKIIEYYVVNNFLLGHFEFAHIKFTSFLPFIGVTLFFFHFSSSLELKISLGNKMNSSDLRTTHNAFGDVAYTPPVSDNLNANSCTVYNTAALLSLGVSIHNNSLKLHFKSLQPQLSRHILHI